MAEGGRWSDRIQGRGGVIEGGGGCECGGTMVAFLPLNQTQFLFFQMKPIEVQRGRVGSCFL